MEIYYQGEDIPFQIELFEDSGGSKKINIDSLSNLIVYMFTDGASVIKMSKVAKNGYLTLLRKDEYKYSCIVDSSLTKLLAEGVLFIEVNIINSSPDLQDGKINRLQKHPIGRIQKTLIKIES